MALTMIGAESMKTLFQIVCEGTCIVKPFTEMEWYLMFMCLAVLIAQLPNLNSIAGVSLIGALAAVGYCTVIWVLPVTQARPSGVSYVPPETTSNLDRAFRILNALGIIAFAFRGHNLVLEIQVHAQLPQKSCRYVNNIRIRISISNLIRQCFLNYVAGNDAFY